VYKHALEEVEVPLGDESSSCERRKVQEEAGGARLWVSKACLKAMYVLQVGVQKIEQLAHHNEAWYGQILD